MMEHLERERTETAKNVHTAIAPYATASMMLLSRYHQRLDSGSPGQMDFRRYKLLRSLHADNGRGEQVIQALLQGTPSDDPMLDADDASPAMIRMRLIVEIQNGNFTDASYLLGKLDDMDHDVGERAYFHALVSFASGGFKRTIKHADKVPAEAIDRPRAAWLAIKAAAQLSDIVTFDRLLAEICDRLTPCAWLHLIELLDPGENGTELSSLEERLPSNLRISSSDPAYEEWAIHHTHMMGRVEARDREIAEVTAVTGVMPTDAEIAADPIYRRYLGVFFVDKILRGSDETWGPAQWLLPVIAEGNVGAFRTAVERLSEAGDYMGVVTLANRFPSSRSLRWQRDLAIVTIVYSAAVATNNSLARRLEHLLSDEQLAPVVTSVRRMTVAARLTPMGRISFMASATELDRVEAAGDNWRDCGLISLGLFRSLEVELNARLVRPLAAQLDVSQLLLQLPETAGALRKVLRELRDTSAKGHGMMLGPLRNLLVLMGSKNGDAPEIAVVRDAVRTGFYALVSDAGRRASAFDSILEMISSTVVGRFRNPPAHGQYLRLSEAAPALSHVEDSLDKLAQWLPVVR
jgi:hypothetical protein